MVMTEPDSYLTDLPTGSRPIRFLIRYLIIYALFEALYFLVPNSVLHLVYHYGIVNISAELVSLITPQIHVLSVDNRLVWDQVALEVVRGCDGAGVAFLLVSAILAFPARSERRITGILGAVCLVLALNQLRLITLFYLAAYREAWFLPTHVYIAPMLMIIVGALFFIWWITSAGRSVVNEGV